MKKLLGFLLLSLIMILSATGLTACGCSGCGCNGGGSNDKGTYYKYSDGNYDKNDYLILSGSSWTDDGGYSGTYEIKDGNIYLYVTIYGEKTGLYKGTIKDGVMLLKKIIGDEYYCKEGCKPPLNINENTDTDTTPEHTHNYIETVIKPTCTESGYTIKKCSTCGDEEIINYVDATGHNYVNGICTVCGEKATPTDGSYFKFRLLVDDTYAIRVKDPTNLPANVIIAPSYYGTAVTVLEDDAFRECDTLKSIIIPESVTSISWGAFAFCSNLKSVILPNTIQSIEDAAFRNCKLSSITIPDSVTSIGNAAFYHCSNLQTVNIPDSVISIENDAFADCYALQYNEYDNGLYLGNTTNPYLALMKTRSSAIAKCAIHKNTKIICEAFYNCENIKNITIPNSVTTIEDYAFYNCSNLEVVTIPNSVTKIGESAFRNCISLTSVTIPNSVTCIGDYTFFACTSLTSVTIPNSVTSIGDWAFFGCTSLTSITFVGSKKQWQEISKGYLWNTYAMVVHCTDGDVSI